MLKAEITQLVHEVRAKRNELENLEIKTAKGGTPKRLYEALSAFANRLGGGIVLFGLDEERGFEVVGVGNAQKLMEEVGHLATTDMEPVLRPRFEVDEIDGLPVVVAEIDEIPVAHKPCYFKQAGLPKGAYIRVGNTNRQMTDYEVFGYVSSRTQPTMDEEPVTAASVSDLDPSRLDAYLTALGLSRPRAIRGTSEETLCHQRVLAKVGGKLHPTLAGLLVFGKYPQEFLPQLRITFVQHYGTTEEEKGPQGERFLDNRSFEGSIVEMLQETERTLVAAMRKSSLIQDTLRRDIHEYPLEALREAIANALAHRDYSPYVRGSYVQIRLFADRLEIQSPGGLFGNVTIDNIETDQSTRNSRLMRMLEDTRLVENRGSGIKAMVEAMRQANLEPPRFDDKRSSFQVMFRNHTLMNPEAISWLNQFADRPLNDFQRMALVFLRANPQMTNGDYQRLNRVHSQEAGRDLRGLVQAGLVEPHGVGRGAFYTLKVSPEAPAQDLATSEEDTIVAFVRKTGSINNTQCRELLKVDDKRAGYLLKKTAQSGRLKPEGTRRWARYVLP